MSYVEDHLLPKETVVYKSSLHWSIYLPAAFLLFMGIGIGFYSSSNELRTLAIYFILIVPVPMTLTSLLKSATSEFAVTNKRVIIKTGFIRRTSIEILLEKIEGIAVEQGILGRILNYGTIVVGGTGASKTPFHNIDDPMRFRTEVQHQIEKKGRR